MEASGCPGKTERVQGKMDTLTRPGGDLVGTADAADVQETGVVAGEVTVEGRGDEGALIAGTLGRRRRLS